MPLGVSIGTLTQTLTGVTFASHPNHNGRNNIQPVVLRLQLAHVDLHLNYALSGDGALFRKDVDFCQNSLPAGADRI